MSSFQQKEQAKRERLALVQSLTQGNIRLLFQSPSSIVIYRSAYSLAAHNLRRYFSER